MYISKYESNIFYRHVFTFKNQNIVLSSHLIFICIKDWRLSNTRIYMPKKWGSTVGSLVSLFKDHETNEKALNENETNKKKGPYQHLLITMKIRKLKGYGKIYSGFKDGSLRNSKWRVTQKTNRADNTQGWDDLSFSASRERQRKMERVVDN